MNESLKYVVGQVRCVIDTYGKSCPVKRIPIVQDNLFLKNDQKWQSRKYSYVKIKFF